MYDLQTLAWQADITRVSTFLLAKELSNATYPKSGIRDAFHILSHHSNIQQNKDRFAVVNAYHVRLLAYFLERLAATPDGDGSLLDHMTILYGSGISNSTRHSGENLPILVMGGGAGRLKGGRHLTYTDKPSMANLLMTLMDKMDVPVERIGGSTGKVQLDAISL
jgi:hypothetical protein